MCRSFWYTRLDYFLSCKAIQKVSPLGWCRNEVDEVDFSRVLFATAGGVLMLLVLIPMVKAVCGSFS